MTREELGSASQTLLDIVNETSGYISRWEIIREAKRRNDIQRTDDWWWERIIALAFTGHIEAEVTQDARDRLAIRFRRKEAEE